MEQRTKVIPLDEIENSLQTLDIDLALNIHSFSECTLEAINWWLSLLEKNQIRYLLIIPNGLDNGGKKILTNDFQDFQYLIEEHGYQLKICEPKYLDPLVQAYAVNPTYHYLFEFMRGKR